MVGKVELPNKAKAVVMGGMLRKEMKPARYSAGGATSHQAAPLFDREWPTAITVTDDSQVHRGVLAAGSRSGSQVLMNGTSVAAPQIARWMADELKDGKPANPKAVEDEADRQEPHPAPAPDQPSARRGGKGRIELNPHNSRERYVGQF